MLRKSLLISAAVAALALTTAPAAMAGGKPVPATTPVPGATLPLNVRAQLAATRIVNTDESAAAAASGRSMVATTAKPLAGEYDSSLVGMAVTASGLQVTVAGHSSAELTRAIAAGADGVPVTIKVVPHSEGQLETVQARITSDLKYWSARGIHLAAWGPDLSADKVSVTLTHYSALAARSITARYGTAWVTVATTSVNAQPSASRTDDFAPWYGGDELLHRINSTTEEICTTGFSLKIGSTPIVPADAHCFGNNYSTNFTNPGGTIGTWYGYDDYHDTLLINASSDAGYIWSDPTSTDRAVTGVASTDPIGGLICTDGLTNREVCSVKIEATNQTITYSINGTSTTVSNTVYACQTAGKAAFSAGDSGGPVETTIGSTDTTARGAVLAYTGDAHCGWYMPERYIESDWGATVVLG
jgi:hypothetical protein